MTLVAQ